MTTVTSAPPWSAPRTTAGTWLISRSGDFWLACAGGGTVLVAMAMVLQWHGDRELDTAELRRRVGERGRRVGQQHARGPDERDDAAIAIADLATRERPRHRIVDDRGALATIARGAFGDERQPDGDRDREEPGRAPVARGYFAFRTGNR